MSLPSATALVFPQAAAQRAGVTFLKHDIRTEHDDLSDLARLYKVRATPTFAFLVGGAKVGDEHLLKQGISFLPGPVVDLGTGNCNTLTHM